jgi:hypothetical protein
MNSANGLISLPTEDTRSSWNQHGEADRRISRHRSNGENRLRLTILANRQIYCLELKLGIRLLNPNA